MEKLKAFCKDHINILVTAGIGLVIAVCLLVIVLLLTGGDGEDRPAGNGTGESLLPAGTTAAGGATGDTGPEDTGPTGDASGHDEVTTGRGGSVSAGGTTTRRTGTDSPPATTTAAPPVNYRGIVTITSPTSQASGDLRGHVEAFKSAFPAGAVPEATPSLFRAGGKYYISIPTAHAVMTAFTDSNPLGALTSYFALDDKNGWVGCDNWTRSGAAHTGGQWATPSVINADDAWGLGQPYWRRNYYTPFDIRNVTINGQPYILSVNHGENKNEKFADGRKYINTVQAKRDYADHEYSGVNSSGVYDDYPQSYFAFGGLSAVPEGDFKKGVRLDDDKYDQGPVVWPSNGYVDYAGNRVNSGIRHPSLFIDGGYIYLYYLDNEKVVVARAPLADKGSAGSFKIYADGGFTQSALPNGFDKTKRNFFTKGAGSPTPVLGNSKSLRFSVAKLKGTPYYLGVEEYYTTWPRAGLRFRLSKDLVNWTAGTEVPGSFVSNYHDGSLHYPMIYSKDFTNRDEIDPAEFYIVGTSGGNIGRSTAEAVKFSIRIS